MMLNKTNKLNYLDCALITHIASIAWIVWLLQVAWEMENVTQKLSWDLDVILETMHQSQVANTAHNGDEDRNFNVAVHHLMRDDTHGTQQQQTSWASWVVCSVVSEWIVFAVGSELVHKTTHECVREAGRSAVKITTHYTRHRLCTNEL